MANLSARLESLLKLYQDSTPHLLIAFPRERSDIFKVIGFSRPATTKEIRNGTNRRSPFLKIDRPPNQTNKPPVSRKQQYIPNHGK